ncbi:MAG: hypothetical protein MUC83_01740 [Pirellula sp.]|nr:hypothetical protein [Pirellula sp.]
METESQRMDLNGLIAGACTLKAILVDSTNTQTDQSVDIRIEFLDRDQTECVANGRGKDLFDAITTAIQSLCINKLEFQFEEQDCHGGRIQWIAQCQALEHKEFQFGLGKSVSDNPTIGATHAAFKAANHAGQLKAAYRSNNQKQLKQIASQTLRELEKVLCTERISKRQTTEAEYLLLESLNRAASSAIIVSSNHPRQDSILSLYDTSSWLYDSAGHKRESLLETDHWLAWYPGLKQDSQTVQDVINTMPSVAASKIPWIIKLLENPESPFRFRGAVSLGDHDVLHVLLGRGLQDQDEAFVIGFAMGTAKKSSPIQRRILRFVLGRVYPEPYRIPGSLLPAFDLGFACGRETGTKDLYKLRLDSLLGKTVRQARIECGLDTEILKRYFRAEQLSIPMTVASVRLPTEP